MTSIPAGDRLVSLVYSSTGATDIDEQQLDSLLEQSRAANGRNDITGILLYRAGRFVQFLEGPADRVEALMANIVADPRHRNVRVLLEGDAPSRQFGEWTMGYQRMTEPDSPLPEGFRSTFDDLEGDDRDEMFRAIRELSFWFRTRASDA